MNDFELHRGSKEWPPSKVHIGVDFAKGESWTIINKIRVEYKESRPSYDLMKEGDQRDVNKE